jgi:hypothetical protein
VKKDSLAARPSEGYSMEMIEGITGFMVETLYYNKWVKTWDASEIGKLPDVVRISIVFSDRDREVKLTEYARPRIGNSL